ncbi:hypothetical protein N9A12_03100 [Gammaproteobacteria bacterium]|nr:hypothetical protein [Gammaproteobacteria bacterium]
MNEETQIQIIELIDEGATLDSSPELKVLVEASPEAADFYEGLLISESMLEGFFGGDKSKELSNKIDSFVDEQFEGSTPSSNFKPLIGFAMAASLAVIAFIFFNSPEEFVEKTTNTQVASVTELIEREPIIEVMTEEPEPIYISGSEIETLWSTAIDLAESLGVDKYQVMYALYEGNIDFFVNANINAPRADKDYFLDMSLVQTVDAVFASDEVKRHIYCNC